MNRKHIARAAAISLCWSLLPGCSNLSSRLASWGPNKAASQPVEIGKIQNDQLGRPLPGSKIPVQPPLEEAKPEISEQTRSHVALAMGEMLETSGSLGSAQDQYEQALKHDPKSLPATLALARLYARQGRPDAALKLYRNAEKYHRRDPALFNDKGLLLAEQKDWPNAIATLRNCVKLDPSEEKYHNNLGMVLAMSGNYEEAWQEFREAVGPGAAHYNVALLMLQNDQRVEARDHLERAIAALPNFQKARELLLELNGGSSPDNNSVPTLASEIQVHLEGTGHTSVASAELSTPQDAEEEPTEPATTAFHSVPFNAGSASDGAKKDPNPWSRRWIPPKWLR